MERCAHCGGEITSDGGHEQCWIAYLHKTAAATKQADREFVHWVMRQYREAAEVVFDLTGTWPSFEELEARREEENPYNHPTR